MTKPAITGPANCARPVGSDCQSTAATISEIVIEKSSISRWSWSMPGALAGKSAKGGSASMISRTQRPVRNTTATVRRWGESLRIPGGDSEFKHE